jgi:hypothetical protein
MSDLSTKVSEWLNKSGYPLEMVVAKALQDAGFGVVRAEYFEEASSGKWRETDVVAYEERRGQTCRAIFALVAECKGGRDKPWVLFTSRDPYPSQLSVARRATTEGGESILNVLALNPDIAASQLFRVPERPGYGLTIAFRETDKSDHAYEALNSVCNATLGLLRRLDAVPNDRIIPFAWPVIVINAPLVEAFLNDDGEVQVVPIDDGLLIWKNPLITRHTLVAIYTKERFLAEASKLRGAALRFLELAAQENDRFPRKPGSARNE